MLFPEAVTSIIDKLGDHFLYSHIRQLFLIDDMGSDVVTGIRRVLHIADGEPDPEEVPDTEINLVVTLLISMMTIQCIRQKMSAGVVQVGIRNQVILLCLDEALRIFARYRPKRVEKTYGVSGRVVTLPNNTLGVAKVSESKLETLFFEPQDLSWVGPVGIQATHHTQGYGSLGDVLGALQVRYTERGFFSDHGWHYHSETRRLILSDRYETGSVTVLTYESYLGIDDLDYDDYGWVEAYAFAGCLEAEGRARGKYTNDFLQMDGDQLRGEGASLRERLVQELMGSQILDFGARA